MSQPISDLATLLASMQPELRPGVFVYVRGAPGAVAPEAAIEAMVEEPEGPTWVIAEADAERLGLPVLFRAAWITLTVHSDLAACGLTAAFSKALADAGISCNVLAGAVHDHLLVPIEQAQAAMHCLQQLSAQQPVSPLTESACANCGATMSGAFCAACGQARFVEADRRLSHLLKQAFDNLTDFDSRLWRSLLNLWFRPGRLTRDYLNGRRQFWMPPISLFLLANVLYFFAPAITDFELPFVDQVPGPLMLEVLQAERTIPPDEAARMAENSGQMHSRWTAKWVKERVAARDAGAKAADPSGHYTMADYARAYDARSPDISKLLIIVHVPIMALVLSLLLLPLRRYFAEHMVIAFHVFTFILFDVVLLVQGMAWLAERWGWPLYYPILGALSLLPIWYGAETLRKSLDLSAIVAYPVAFALMLGLVLGNISIYRFVQFALIFALT
ncbi:ACT domain-containing protein [Ahniella affigens]|uniref:ACT domain-containing protein n=1 Tax=Ahniella affigens TaxID=2021234 RepID=UPI00147369A5|nr:ACT domain-containing protein [Ahniella affigens]